MADMIDIILAKALAGKGAAGGTGEGDPVLDRRVTALEEELDTLLDENGKISEGMLPEDWVRAQVDTYVGEALGGEY